MKIAALVKRKLIDVWKMQKLRGVYREFRQDTMIRESVYVGNLQLAGKIKNINGSIVECGVWRGGMSAGLAKVLGEDRNYYLFDSFEGLPEAKEVDGPNALNWQKEKGSENYHDNCTASKTEAEQAMTRSGVNSFHLIEGWFSDTLPSFEPVDGIALLRLDGDWYDSTMTCLNSLFDKVLPGGLIVLDDYYTWDGCSRAVHDFLSERSAVERIHAFRGVCYIKKQCPRLKE